MRTSEDHTNFESAGVLPCPSKFLEVVYRGTACRYGARFMAQNQMKRHCIAPYRPPHYFHNLCGQPLSRKTTAPSLIQRQRSIALARHQPHRRSPTRVAASPTDLLELFPKRLSRKCSDPHSAAESDLLHCKRTFDVGDRCIPAEQTPIFQLRPTPACRSLQTGRKQPAECLRCTQIACHVLHSYAACLHWAVYMCGSATDRTALAHRYRCKTQILSLIHI